MARGLVNGQMYGLWEAISGPVLKRWYCKCTGCGKHQFVNTKSVWSGKSTRCRQCSNAKPELRAALQAGKRAWRQRTGRQKLENGKEYGWLTAVEGPVGDLSIAWLCKCRCGRIVKETISRVVRGVIDRCLACRKFQREEARRSRLAYAGSVFGELEVVGKSSSGGDCVDVQCHCGRFQRVRSDALFAGIRVDCTACRSRRLHRPRLVDSSRLMKHLRGVARWIHWRLEQSNSRVQVCEQWHDIGDFAKYLATLDGCNDRRLTVDRIDNYRGYEPGNIRFATKSEQQMNKRNSPTERYKVLGDAFAVLI